MSACVHDIHAVAEMFAICSERGLLLPATCRQSRKLPVLQAASALVVVCCTFLSGQLVQPLTWPCPEQTRPRTGSNVSQTCSKLV